MTHLPKKGASIATKYSDIFWNNDEARMDRINIVKKECLPKISLLKRRHVWILIPKAILATL